MAQKKIVVIGCTGNVGSATLDYLNKKAPEDVHIVAGTRDPKKADKLQTLSKVEVVEADMAKPETVEAAAKGASAVFIVSPGAENRAQLVQNAVKAVKKAGVPFILVVSVATVDKMDTIFGKQFTEIEESVRTSGIDFSLLRLPLFIDNNWLNKDTIHADGTIYGPADPFKKFTPIAVQDVGKAAATILLNPQEHKGTGYTLCSRPLTHHDLADLFAKELGRPIKYVQVPYEDAKKAFMSKGIAEWQVDGMLELYRLIDKDQYVFDEHTMEQVTGEKPMTAEQWVDSVGTSFV